MTCRPGQRLFNPGFLDYSKHFGPDRIATFTTAPGCGGEGGGRGGGGCQLQCRPDGAGTTAGRGGGSAGRTAGQAGAAGQAGCKVSLGVHRTEEAAQIGATLSRGAGRDGVHT